MTDDLDRLDEIASAAAAHPWGRHWECRLDDSDTYVVVHDSERVVEIAASTERDDAEHIAAFDPPTVLALIARVREAEAKVEAVRAFIGPRDDLDPDFGGCEGAWDGDLVRILDMLGEDS